MSRLLASAFAVLLLASACSGGDGDNTTENGTDGVEQAAAQTDNSDEVSDSEPADSDSADADQSDASAADDEAADTGDSDTTNTDTTDTDSADAAPASDESASLEGFCQIVQENNTLMDDFDVSQGKVLDVGAFQERTGPILAAAPDAIYDDLQAFFVFTTDFMVIFEGVDTDDPAATAEAYAPFEEEFDLRAAEIDVSNARLGEFLQAECGLSEAFGL